MTKNDILAVVVTHNGVATIRDTVDALIGRVDHIHIVDNGSSDETKAILSQLHDDGQISVLFLQENKGIGVALNVGIETAKARGCSWMLAMDQDSVVDKRMIEAYCDEIHLHPELVCLSPNIVKNGDRPRLARDRDVSYAITSGNLVRTDVCEGIGRYDEGFFIDCIDFDFCLRLRRAGHRIVKVGNAWMRHELGIASGVPRGIALFYTRHVPMRRYYMARNHMYMLERYVSNFPWFMIKLTLLQVLSFALVLMLESDRGSNVRWMVRGMGDYFRRRQGAFRDDDPGVAIRSR